MKNILDEIAEKTRKRVEARKNAVPFEQMKAAAQRLPANDGFPFEKALKRQGLSFICEIKKASPSKGLIAPDFPYLEIASEYEKAGADALSVLTEPYYFQGSDEYLRQIKQRVSLPTLRKDFTVDPYMIYEAKTLNANCVLLIAALLDQNTLREYCRIADSLGLSALVETHNEREVDAALNSGARIIGVNNRDLKTFTVDLQTSVRLREHIPKEYVFVSESGIKTPEDTALLRGIGADAVLIGETLMRSSDRRQMLSDLRGSAG